MIDLVGVSTKFTYVAMLPKTGLASVQAEAEAEGPLAALLSFCFHEDV